MIRRLSIILVTVLLSSCANSQNRDMRRLTGGPCEGCEAIFEYGDELLSPTDMLPDFHKEGVKIKVEGTIYQNDGKTPANNVILYIYHTNQNGMYAPAENAEGWAKIHGYNRGWIRTDETGRYAFYTLKPAPYPNRSEPAHIHCTILEPNGKYYWLNSYHFKGDDLLTNNEINPDTPRGGSSGLLTLIKEGDIWVGTRNIVLGKNIPGY